MRLRGSALESLARDVGKRGLRAADQVAGIPSLEVSSYSQVFGRPRMFACVGRVKIDTEPAQPSAKSKPPTMTGIAPGISKPLRYAAISCPSLLSLCYDLDWSKIRGLQYSWEIGCIAIQE
jgi:hypothetical protein